MKHLLRMERTGVSRPNKSVSILRRPESCRFSAGKAVATARSPTDMKPMKKVAVRENFIVTASRDDG